MIGTRYITENRKPLIDLLPLEAPLVLFIDPSDACNLKCSFCPTSDNDLMQKNKRPLIQMDFDSYKKIIDSLQQFKTNIKVLRLYSHGEPLINKNFYDIVKYAKASGKIDSVDTTTNGLMLHPKRNIEIIESGIDRINISINGLSKEQYQSFTRTNVNFDKLVSNIKHLYDNRKQCYIFIKINGDTISPEDEKRFLEIFEPIADSVAIERSMSCWNGFDSKGFKNVNDSIGVYGQEINKPVDVCPYIFYSVAVQSDLKVSLCFLDWNRKLIIGDLNKETLYSIWYSDALLYIRRAMLQNKRYLHSICGKCDQLLKGLPSNIDEHKEYLLNIYKGE
jgi:MoaA/NifB/PqqE/SkfB family radical SAM enzyme